MKEKLALIDDTKEQLHTNFYILVTAIIGSIVLYVFFFMLDQGSSTGSFIFYVGGIITVSSLLRHMTLQSKINSLLYEIAAYYVLKK